MFRPRIMNNRMSKLDSGISGHPSFSARLGKFPGPSSAKRPYMYCCNCLLPSYASRRRTTTYAWYNWVDSWLPDLFRTNTATFEATNAQQVCYETLKLADSALAGLFLDFGAKWRIIVQLGCRKHEQISCAGLTLSHCYLSKTIRQRSMYTNVIINVQRILSCHAQKIVRLAVLRFRLCLAAGSLLWNRKLWSSTGCLVALRWILYYVITVNCKTTKVYFPRCSRYLAFESVISEPCPVIKQDLHIWTGLHEWHHFRL